MGGLVPPDFWEQLSSGVLFVISDLGGLNSKNSVRKGLKERTRLFVQSPTLKSSAEARVVSQVSSLIFQLGFMTPSSVVAGFNALSDEPDLSSFYQSALCALVFPKLVAMPDVQAMEFTRVENYATEKWDVSHLGFRHPSSVDVVAAGDIDVMLIPGLGFSAQGDRLGRGKGFYDRYLNNFKGLKVGVCFDCQWSEVKLPADSWDIKMDYIITETKCLKV